MALVFNRLLAPAGLAVACASLGCATGTDTDTATQASATTPMTVASSSTSDASSTGGSGTTDETTMDPSAGGTPGIDVTPPSELTVREAGDPQIISVVLESPPSGDVTIAVTSSDEDEGAALPAELIFTADDWDQPQEVSVTGVDDGEPDGAQPFTIELGPVTSDDEGYAALDPEDYEFTNLDLYDHVMDTTLEDTPLGANWSCEIASDAGALVMRTINSDEPQFELRVGAGGSITSIRDIPLDMMLPSTELLEAGPITESVTQWTTSSSSVSYDHPDLLPFEDSYKINQSGNSAGAFSPTVSVTVDFGACIIDVFSVPQDQWFSELDPFINNKLSMRTRIKMIGNGRVFVRRTMLVDRVVLEGVTTEFANFSLDATNFIDVDPFAHLAYTVSDLGFAETFKSVGDIPTENDQAVDLTSGYIAMLDVNNQDSFALGVIYGTKEVCRANLGECEFTGSHQLSLREFLGEYVRLIPSLRLQNLEEGAIVDASTVLLMQRATSTAFGVNINEWAETIDQPVVLPPGSVVWPDDFAGLAAQLDENLNASGDATDLLGPLAGL